MKFTKILILLLGITVMFSCKSKKEVAEVATKPNVEQTEARRSGTIRPGGGERGGRGDFQARQAEQQAKLYAELGLSDAQKTKMEEIQKSTRQTMQAMRAESRDGGDRTAMREKMQAIRKAETEEVKKIMTAEQFTKYEKFLEERRGQRGGRGGRGGGGRGN